MAVQASFEFEGKEFTVWSQSQLSGINRQALTQRAMQLRDAVGQDRLPQMPRDPAGMADWILEVQQTLQGDAMLGQGGARRAKPESEVGGYVPTGHGAGNAAQRGGLKSSEDRRPSGRTPPPSAGSGAGRPRGDEQSATAEARAGREAAKQRNQEGSMAGIFGT